MATRHRFGLFFGGVATLALLVLAAIGILSRSEWGHAQVRKQVLGLIQGNVHGIVRMGRVSGNLLSGATIEGFAILDSAGVPFFTAERMSGRYRLRSFLNQRLAFDDVTLTRPLLRFDKLPGQKWNMSRLWPSTHHPPGYVHRVGWGDWFELTNIHVIDGRVLVRTSWHPNDTLTGRAREASLERAMGPKGRFVLEQVPGGWQRVSDFTHLNGILPRLRLSDPSDKWMLADVSTMTGMAYALKGPPADIRDLKGRFQFNGDSAWFDNIKARLPGSKLTGGGRYYVSTDNVLLHLLASPASFKDFQWVYADFPDSGGGPIDFSMKWWDGEDTYTLRNLDFRVGRSHVEGNSTITIYQVPDTVAFSNTELKFANFDSRLIERVPPGIKFPRVGTMTGRASVSGGTAGLDVDADIAYDDAKAGHNHIVARGILGVRKVYRARELHLTMEPVQVALARDYMKRLPVGGTITGNIVVSGDERTGFAARGGIVHEDRGLVSRATGRGTVKLAARGGSPWMDLDLRMHPLALAEAGRFAPKLGLRGFASGPLKLKGTMANLVLDADFAVSGGGSIAAKGSVALAGAVPSYDLRTRMTVFDANVVIAKAPRTSLTGDISARGRGTDPATMQTAIAGHLTAIRIDTLSADSAWFRVAAADGLLRIDTLRASGRGMFAAAQGTLGLREGRTGELRYDVRVDSLQSLSFAMPKAAVDTSSFLARPRRASERLARARSDSARIAKATEVERAATGRKGPGPVRVAGPPAAVKRDALSGALRAQGVLSGSIVRLDTKGTLDARDVVARGSFVHRAIVQYEGADLRSPTAKFSANATLDSLLIAGFELDSARATVTYSKPGGTADITIHQSDGEFYVAKGDFILHPDHNEIHLADLTLQIDTTRWVSAQPTTIHWGPAGIEVRKLELLSQHGGRLYVNGVLPTEGTSSGGLDVQVTKFQVGDLAALLESDLKATGLIDLSGRIEGTLRNPRMRGTLAIASATYGGTALPDVRGTFGYADGILTTHAEAYGVPGDSAKGILTLLASGRKSGEPLLTVNGRIPINLGVGNGLSLFTDGELALDLKADSLPIDLIPQFTTMVANVKGNTRGDIRVRGTLKAPRLEGAVTLANGQFTIVPNGVTLTGVSARLTMRNDTLMIDSLAARAGSGYIEAGGLIDLKRIAQPAFDMRIAAVNARVLDNEQGRVNADATIGISGPFEAVCVDGTVNIRNGVLYVPESGHKSVINTGDPTIFAVVDTSVRRDKELIGTESPFLSHLEMNVALTVQHGTWVRSKEANVEIYGDLNIKMDRSKSTLALDGAINTDRGEYSLFSKRFQIRQGTATFLDLPEQGLNPILQITAENEIRVPGSEPLVVKLTIGGTLENPRLALSSNSQPPIPQSDLLSYVAFGRSGGTLLQVGGGSSLGGAATNGGIAGSAIMGAAGSTLTGMAVGVLADEIEGEATRSMGIDQFSINPDPELYTQLASRNVNGVLQGTTIEAGKYVNPRTFVAVQSRLDPTNSPPGLRLQARAKKGFQFEATLEPRLPLRKPTLEDQGGRTAIRGFSVFGAYLIREWRF